VPGEARATSVIRQRRLRADARRNRELLLAAARDAFVAHGADAPLDDVARRAGVGIGTLYRHFPDRRTLLREVALDLLGHSADEAGAALAEEADAFGALARYMHRALDLRIAAVMPEVVGRVRMDDEALHAARRASIERIERIIATAHADGTLRPDVASGDIGLLLVRLTRPLPGAFPAEVDHQLAHRHLDVLLDGLRSAANHGAPLPDSSLTFDDLADMSAQRPQPPANTGHPITEEEQP
jgi:AcrR family transcriptional regulator